MLTLYISENLFSIIPYVENLTLFLCRCTILPFPIENFYFSLYYHYYFPDYYRRNGGLSISSIYELIVSQYVHMTVAERRVADYFLQHKPNTLTMSITPIANVCNVSPATLTRFARKLGCESFSVFRSRLFEEAPAIKDDIHDFYSEVQASDSVEEKSKKLLYIYNDALRSTQALISEDGIHEAVDLLWNAKTVYCFGQGSSSSVALDAVTRFAPITSKFHWIADSHLQSTTAALLSEDEVILYFSFSGSTRELLETGQLVRNSPGKMILVTRFPNAPGVPYCDVLLQCGANESPKNQGAMAAKIVQLYIIDILFNEYSSRNVESAIQRRKKTLDATSKKMITSTFKAPPTGQ